MAAVWLFFNTKYGGRDVMWKRSISSYRFQIIIFWWYESEGMKWHFRLQTIIRLLDLDQKLE